MSEIILIVTLSFIAGAWVGFSVAVIAISMASYRADSQEVDYKTLMRESNKYAVLSGAQVRKHG